MKKEQLEKYASLDFCDSTDHLWTTIDGYGKVLWNDAYALREMARELLGMTQLERIEQKHNWNSLMNQG